MVERRDRVAAAGDRDELAGLGALGGVLGRRDRRPVERLDLEGAERAVPDQRRGAVDPVR